MISFVFPSEINLEERGRYYHFEMTQFLQIEELTESQELERPNELRASPQCTWLFLDHQLSWHKKIKRKKIPTTLNMKHSSVGVLSIRQSKNMIQHESKRTNPQSLCSTNQFLIKEILDPIFIVVLNYHDKNPQVGVTRTRNNALR